MSIVERRRPAFDSELLIRSALVWLAICAALVVAKWSAIADFALPDADDTLRLLRLRELLAGQSWFDLYEHRIDPPRGVLMHWSRLVDVPLLLVNAALAPLLGPALAERLTLVVVPLLTLGAALLLAGRIAWRLLDAKLITVIGLLMVMTIPLAAQLGPLRIDHHGWQIVAVLAALNAMMARTPRRGAWIMGIALGLGMVVSLEMLPVAGIFAAVLALRWLQQPREREWLVHFMPALLLTAALALLATHGMADLASHCDSLSLPYLIGLSIAATGVVLLGAVSPLPRQSLLLGLGITAVLTVGAVLALAPQCRSGPFVMLDPLVQRMWYANVSEGMPVWHLSPGAAAVLMVPPLVGLLGALRLAGRSFDWLRRYWFDHAMILAGLTLLGTVVSRAAVPACAVALVPFAWQLREWVRSARTRRSLPVRAAALAGVAMVASPAIPVNAAKHAFASEARARPLGIAGAQQRCDVPAAAPALDQLEPATLLTPIDLGPVILVNTRHSVVATAHHRAAGAIHDVYAAFLAGPAAARPLIAAHGAGYVLICPAMADARNIARAAPGGLLAQLLAGTPPPWLEPVELPAGTGLKLWRVTPQT